jgi:ankyrin repeat protein
MDAKALPSRPSLEQYKKQAKDLVKGCKSGDAEAMRRVKAHHPRGDTISRIALADAQVVIAREHGFESWPKFAKRIETSTVSLGTPLDEFVVAACVPRDSGHASGTLQRAEEILAAHPEIAGSSIYSAAILGDDGAVQRFLALDAGSATAKGGPHGWDALTYLCFSRYLRLDRARSDGFVRAAAALLDAGASANTGFYEKAHEPSPEFESALYGAAGVAHHEGLTRLLLDRGADPNDGEVPYHAPEGYDNRALKALVESGRVNQDSLATMLLRKHDWHDGEGIRWLLDHGADPNRMTRWGRTALHQAVLRDNALEIVEAALDHGADPRLESGGRSAVAMAARRGRGDLLALFEGRGIAVELHGVERLLAACARNDSQGVRAIAAGEPQLVSEVVAEGGKVLAEFAGVGNTEGVRQLLDLGIDAAARFTEGDGYWDVAKDSTALHVAAWRSRHGTVKLLIERGAPVNALDGKGRTPLMLAVRACVDSYWMDRRSPESVEALLRAGAPVDGVSFPCGYREVDDLLH